MHNAHVKSARNRVRQVAMDWGLALSIVADLALLASELVTNALLHGQPARGCEIGVTLVLTPEHVRIEVRDAGNGLPEMRAAGEGEQSGRGLFLVDALSDRWGHITQVVGKTIYAEIDLKRATPANGRPVVRA
ncbi:ATP-binding protein [Streptomyces xanthophaeus]|uniref:ATP-binding protein n=1 Tax=Streptomyces xanthophaeus TaxID=67385 RepID=UPI00386E57ED|nr:ATP-binding protein [Streptomyces xanthophaeus]